MLTKRELANTIRLEMHRRKLTIENLAEISQMSRSTITRVLNPNKLNSVKYDSLLIIIDSLKINPRQFSLNSTYIRNNYLLIDDVSTYDYPLETLSQFLIYFPLILRNLHQLSDIIWRIQGNFHCSSDTYELDQLKRLYLSFEDGPTKEYADALCSRIHHLYNLEDDDLYEDGSILMTKGYKDYTDTLFRFFQFSDDLQSFVDERIFS